ncbi:MAG TPA: protein kinase [Candidatus Krumholzibacteria bacterium]|nr:protein kinase [Candidatus Krumholzibacteria bacterium]
MALSNGTRLGPYEILGPLGAGGMGEVYRARDTRLDRSVAIKVIPEHLVAQAEVRQRFEREARAVSALNHPHICVLHDIGQEGSTYFFVMEYLEGESLASRLEKGPLPRDEFFAVAIQVADALAAAHRAGIVHRDLKPGNIVLTRSGAKLLDFGLARATGLAAAPGSGLTQSPTLTRPLTAEGTIVGTFQYMAPEQLEGKEADARSDIFAFGAVLYEMATGQHAFEGTSQASLIAAIIKETPRPMGEIMPMTPPALENLVRRALSKRPDDRWQSASDMKLQLEWIRDAGSQAGVPAPLVMHRRNLTRALWIGSIASALAAIALGSYIVTHRPQPAPVMRFNVLPPPNTVFDDAQSNMAVSPDGSMLAFVAIDSTGVPSLWVRRFANSNATHLAHTESAMHAFWSPDSRNIAFFADRKLRRVSVDDGSVQTITDALSGRGGTWNENGDIVFQPRSAGPLMHVRASGGDANAVTVVDSANGEDAHRFPCFLGDGKHFLFAVLPAKDEVFNLRIGSLDGATTGVIGTAAGAAVFAPPDYVIYARERQLFARRIDMHALKLVGEPIPLNEAPGRALIWTSAPGASVSRNGVLAHSAPLQRNTALLWVDRSGRETGRLALTPGSYSPGSFSPDGSALVLSKGESTEGGNNLWTVDVRRALATRFTFSNSTNFTGTWSPDGRQIVFGSSRDGRENLFLKPADGSSDEKRIIDTGELFKQPECFTPDGSGLVFNTLSQATSRDLLLYSLKDGSIRPLLNSRFREADAAISPDGRWMVYRSNESGRSEMYVRSFPGMTEKQRISDNTLGVWDTDGSVWVAWRGREILFPGSDQQTVVSVDVSTGPQFHAAPPRALFRLPSKPSGIMVAPDAQRLLVFEPDTRGAPNTDTVILNWTQLLERR